jgi:hypothetical protein
MITGKWTKYKMCNISILKLNTDLIKNVSNLILRRSNVDFTALLVEGNSGCSCIISRYKHKDNLSVEQKTFF